VQDINAVKVRINDRSNRLLDEVNDSELRERAAELDIGTKANIAELRELAK
jgi:hypothetical protein